MSKKIKYFNKQIKKNGLNCMAIVESKSKKKINKKINKKSNKNVQD